MHKKITDSLVTGAAFLYLAGKAAIDLALFVGDVLLQTANSALESAFPKFHQRASKIVNKVAETVKGFAKKPGGAFALCCAFTASTGGVIALNMGAMALGLVPAWAYPLTAASVKLYQIPALKMISHFWKQSEGSAGRQSIEPAVIMVGKKVSQIADWAVKKTPFLNPLRARMKKGPVLSEADQEIINNLPEATQMKLKKKPFMKPIMVRSVKIKRTITGFFNAGASEDPTPESTQAPMKQEKAPLAPDCSASGYDAEANRTSHFMGRGEGPRHFRPRG